MIKVNSKRLLIMILVIGLCAPLIAISSTVLTVGLNEVASKSEFIFEGRVLSKETRPSPPDNRPFTYFTFEIIDVIKGSYPNKYIELGFAGGTINGLTMEVTDLQMPELKEKGIYFVESLSKELIHPLYGWNQGHYLVMNISGAEKVVQADMAATQSLSTAPTINEFKQNIRNILEGAQ